MDAIPKAAVKTVNIDIEAIAWTVERRIARLAPFRAQIVTECPTADIRQFDDLPRHLLALIAAQRAHDVAKAPASVITDLGNQLTTDFGLMMDDADLLSRRGFVPATKIDRLRARSGYTNLIWNVFDLVTIFRECWHAVEGKTALTLAALDKAEADADKLGAAWAASKEKNNSELPTFDDRARCFTLFLEDYDAVRRCLTYLRWNDKDVDQILPSLYAGRRSSSSDKDESDDATDAPADGAQPVVVPPAPPAGGGQPVVATAPTGSTTGSAPRPGTGTPGSEPFGP